MKVSNCLYQKNIDLGDSAHSIKSSHKNLSLNFKHPFLSLNHKILYEIIQDYSMIMMMYNLGLLLLALAVKQVIIGWIFTFET